MIGQHLKNSDVITYFFPTTEYLRKSISSKTLLCQCFDLIQNVCTVFIFITQIPVGKKRILQ